MPARRRTSPTVTGVRAVQLPARLRWSHNRYYQRWLLRQLPARVERALDVGCGTGALACALARRGAQVDAVDLSPDMIAAARQRESGHGGHVRWLVGDVLDHDLPLADGGYDAITAVSSLHHLPLAQGIQRLGALVRPGGVLVVVGLYRPQTPVDRCFGIAAVVANAAVGAVLAATGQAGTPEEDDMPVQVPAATLAQVRRAAAVLSGARITRGLYWRYLLLWHCPPQP